MTRLKLPSHTLGDDFFDVSQVDGYNIPVSIQPGLGAVNSEEMSNGPRICSTNSDCPSSPWYCDTTTNQCTFSCGKDTDCGSYPTKCDTSGGGGKGVWYNSLAVPYLCTEPGCTGSECAPQAACGWNLSNCPSALQVRNSSGKVVGCTSPKDLCGNNFSNGGFSFVPACSGGPGRGTCPAGLICNAPSNGVCLTPISCSGGPNAKGTCPQPGSGNSLYCSAASNGFCFDAYQCNNGVCPAGLTCNAANNMCVGCTSETCPNGFTCTAGGFCAGPFGDCPAGDIYSNGNGECAGQCTGSGQGTCPAGDLCSASNAGQCAQPVPGFAALNCYGSYNTTALTSLTCTGGPNAQGSCPAGMLCSGASGSCEFPLCTSSSTVCSSNLDSLTLDGANTYTCVNGLCQGCPAGAFEVCNGSNTCVPTNTSLHSCAGPNSTSCQITSGTYDACFSNSDCPPGTACDLTGSDANEFTCVDNTSFACGNSPAQSCPAPGVCDNSRNPSKCAVGGQSCTTNAQCGSPLICNTATSTCEMPSYCGGPLNSQWNALVTDQASGNYPNVFKSACPTAYSYPFDDATSTFQCEQSAAGLFNGESLSAISSLTYVVTFCPVPGTLPTLTATPRATQSFGEHPTPVTTRTATATATRTPGPAILQLSTTTVALEAVKVGTYKAQNLVLMNSKSSGRIITINGTAVSGKGFSRDASSCSTLAPGASCTVTIGFSPNEIGLHKGLAIISSDADNAANVGPVKLTGRGVH